MVAAESTWIDTTVIIIVISVGMVIMYKALKEPLDLLFGAMKKAIISIKEMIVGAGDAAPVYGEIVYG